MKRFLIISSIILILAGGLTALMLNLAKVECSLCIVFKGHRLCSKALGPNAQEAADEAQRNACALITGGVTEVVACHRTERLDVQCSQP